MTDQIRSSDAAETSRGPRIDVPDEAACYRQLVALLHPGGLSCPHCGSAEFIPMHDRRHAPVLDHRCARCRRGFDAWTGTLWQGARCPPSELFAELLCALDRVARDGPRPATASRARPAGFTNLKGAPGRGALQSVAAPMPPKFGDGSAAGACRGRRPP